MTAKTQRAGENVSLYFHEKVKLCQKLHLTFNETKEQIIICLVSPTLASMLMARHHTDIDHLFEDVVSYERINSERRDRFKPSRTLTVPMTNRSMSTSSVGQRSAPQARPNTQLTGFSRLASNTTFERRCYNCNDGGHLANVCPKPKREPGTCFTCGKHGHKAPECPEKADVKKEDPNRVAHCSSFKESLIPARTTEVEIILDKLRLCLNSILDLGSPVSFIKEEFVDVSLMDTIEDESFVGMNQSQIKLLGSIKRNIKISSITLEVKFYIIRNNTMQYPCLLGRDVLCHEKIRFTIDQGVVSIGPADVLLTDDCVNQIMCIDVTDNINNILGDLDIDTSIVPNDRLQLEADLRDRYLTAKTPDRPETNIQMTITLETNHSSFYYAPRRLSYADKCATGEIINDLLQRGIMRKSSSEYSSPIVLVQGKSGRTRMCVDYRALNKMTKRDNFPIPNIDDQIETLRDKKYFTKLDLKDAFHHISINEESVKFTSFVTPFGQYEYLKMPFGLKNCPAMFMRFINTAFQHLLERNKIAI